MVHFVNTINIENIAIDILKFPVCILLINQDQWHIIKKRNPFH